MKYILGLLLLVLISTGLLFADCTTQCGYGYHAVCYQECNPALLPLCVPICRCHCVHD
jgi:hypothetical protein